MAIIVVTDTSPLRALHHLGLLELCATLYGEVLVPDVVSTELKRPTFTCPAIDIAAFPGFAIRTSTANPAILNVPGDLDPGESQAITLALELRADLLLMDERKGTEAARKLGLITVGVFGILLEAKRKRLIDLVLPRVDRLIVEQNLFVSTKLRLQIAQLAGE